ncbi:meiosis-specific nuclear structural protein 1 [Drosophila takahashii]|uniref:meiosis-specific nuclear structural protein 1 n=1 Tax=Drosophila takahashii TaxID=29030 RepID=UPI001CF89B04|nr:trichohyalin [Drosophila takahashii]
MATARNRSGNQKDSGIFHIGEPQFKVPQSLRMERDFYSSRLFQQMQHDLEKVNRSQELSKENPMTRDFVEKAAMTQEMQAIKHAEFVEKKRRQQLRRDCEELRDLAEQLRLAAISKELAESLEERKRQRQMTVRVEAQEVADERCLMDEKEREKEAALKEEQRRLRDSLAGQMEENRRRRQQEHAQVMNDRELSLLRQKQIQEEDRAQQLEAERKKLQKRQDMLQSIKENQEHREWQRAQNNYELGDLAQTQSEMDRRKLQLEEERQEVQRKKQEISIRLGQQVLEMETKKRHRDNLLLDLLEAEYTAKSDERFRQQMQQEQVSRRRTRQELDRYRQEVEQRKMAQLQLKRAEMAARQEEAPDVSSQEAEKQLEDYRRRRAHGATLLAMIEDNQRKRAEATAENVQYFDAKARTEAEQQERIKQERLTMLGQVPASVLRYLPKHLLTATDREHFCHENLQALGGGDS